MNGLVTIGHLAEAAGVNVETIRHYQRRGLLEPPCPIIATLSVDARRDLHRIR